MSTDDIAIRLYEEQLPILYSECLKEAICEGYRNSNQKGNMKLGWTIQGVKEFNDNGFPSKEKVEMIDGLTELVLRDFSEQDPKKINIMLSNLSQEDKRFGGSKSKPRTTMKNNITLARASSKYNHALPHFLNEFMGNPID